MKGAQNPDTAVIDPEIATSIRRMLETVVAPGGTAYPQAVVPNYLVAGKTGTARAASGGGYENRYISLFVGMVPASNPRLVGVVIIHDPQGALYYGGYVSAPVFSKVMSGALRLLDVPPDNVKNWYTGSPQGGPTIDAKAPTSDDYVGSVELRRRCAAMTKTRAMSLAELLAGHADAGRGRRHRRARSRA